MRSNSNLKKENKKSNALRRITLVFKKTIKRVEISDIIAEYFFKIFGLASLLILMLIFFYLIKNSISFLFSGKTGHFLLGLSWRPTSFVKPTFGILPMILSTIMITFGALVLAAPLGVFSAVFLAEYLPRRISSIIRATVEVFSSIPSVIIGLIGVTFIAPFFAHIFHWENTFNGYIASFLVGIMALPTIINISLDALLAVPQNLKAASLGLGASKWETVNRVVLPSAKSGIFTAIMLGMGRAVGETMIVLMVAGNSIALPTSYGEPVRTLTATIAIEMGEVARGSLHYSALFSIGLILFIFTFTINYIADKIISKKDKA